MHGIHHSDYREETDSNWSSLPSWWDLDPRHHETSRRVSAIATGVPAYQQAEDVTLGRITALPFSEQREDWKTVDGVPQIRRPAAVRVTPLTGA